jgi:hypothetical protein
MWYFKPFACLYDLLQFGLGHLKGLVTKSELEDRARVTVGVVWDRDEEATAAYDNDGDACDDAVYVGELGEGEFTLDPSGL